MAFKIKGWGQHGAFELSQKRALSIDSTGQNAGNAFPDRFAAAMGSRTPEQIDNAEIIRSGRVEFANNAQNARNEIGQRLGA